MRSWVSAPSPHPLPLSPESPERGRSTWYPIPISGCAQPCLKWKGWLIFNFSSSASGLNECWLIRSWQNGTISMTTNPHSRSPQAQPTPSYSKSMRLTQFPGDSLQSRLYQAASSTGWMRLGVEPTTSGNQSIAYGHCERLSVVLRSPAFSSWPGSPHCADCLILKWKCEQQREVQRQMEAHG